MAAGDRPSLDYNGPLRFGGFRSSTFTLTAAGGTYSIGDAFHAYRSQRRASAILGRAATVLVNGIRRVRRLARASRSRLRRPTGSPMAARSSTSVPSSASVPTADGDAVDRNVRVAADLLTPLFTTNPSLLRYFGMYYTPDLGVTATTDAAFDASLVTHINLRHWARLASRQALQRLQRRRRQAVRAVAQRSGLRRDGGQLRSSKARSSVETQKAPAISPGPFCRREARVRPRATRSRRREPCGAWARRPRRRACCEDRRCTRRQCSSRRRRSASAARPVALLRSASVDVPRSS